MTKVFLPTILIATALIAGAFAMIPVDQATTVHTTIEAATGSLVSLTGVNTSTTSNVVVFDLSSGSEVAHGEICILAVDAGSTQTTVLVQAAPNTGSTAIVLTNSEIEAATGACGEFSTQILTIISGSSTVVDYSVVYISDDA